MRMLIPWSNQEPEHPNCRCSIDGYISINEIMKHFPDDIQIDYYETIRIFKLYGAIAPQ